MVGWSLTSLFSTNTAISETKGQGWRHLFDDLRYGERIRAPKAPARTDGSLDLNPVKHTFPVTGKAVFISYEIFLKQTIGLY